MTALPTHPLTSFAHELRRPQRPASAMGYRMPAEFEAVEAVWMTYPHNAETWPGCFDRVQQQFDFFMSQAARFADVQLTDKRHDWPTNDSWIRDYGPVFVIDGDGGLACHDFIFNGWGGKYGDEYGEDDVVPQRVAQLLDIPIWVHDFVLEGGSIDVNGVGAVMTTEQCLIEADRNPGLNRMQIEAALRAALATSHFIWLPGGIQGDDTDGHIDDVARFIAPNAVIAARAEESHPDHAMLEANWAALVESLDQNGEGIELFELPSPDPIHYDFPADRFGPGGRRACPASYANFLILNEAVLVPTFGQPADDVALAAIEKAMPDRMVIGVRSEYLVVGLGAVHCLTMQQPRRAT
mgnify:CR=1 FL=1